MVSSSFFLWHEAQKAKTIKHKYHQDLDTADPHLTHTCSTPDPRNLWVSCVSGVV